MFQVVTRKTSIQISEVLITVVLWWVLRIQISIWKRRTQCKTGREESVDAKRERELRLIIELTRLTQLITIEMIWLILCLLIRVRRICNFYIKLIRLINFRSCQTRKIQMVLKLTLLTELRNTWKSLKI